MKAKFSNCILYSLWRHYHNGDYIVFRKSRHTHKWPFFKQHWLVLPKGVGNVCPYFKSFTPAKDDLGNYPCPLFRGQVTRGDKE